MRQSTMGADTVLPNPPLPWCRLPRCNRELTFLERPGRRPAWTALLWAAPSLFRPYPFVDTDGKYVATVLTSKLSFIAI